MIVLPQTENRTIVSSFLWAKYGNMTDRQTDRHWYALRAMRTSCKNEY